MPAPRIIPAELFTRPAAGVHLAELRAWGYRIGLAARDALDMCAAIECAVGERDVRVNAITTHFGLGNNQHCLHVEPLTWLRLSETQATRGFQHFLGSNDMRASMFLRALAPEFQWPNDLSDIRVEAESRARRGRIDLLISAKSHDTVWGAVIEAKFEHSIKSNPLSDYRDHGAKLGMKITAVAGTERTGALIIVGKKVCRQTRRRLARNTNWRFVHWREVLRRFDLALHEDPVDEDFRRFRRSVWERAGV